MFSEQVRIGSESSSKQLRNGPIHVTVQWTFGNDHFKLFPRLELYNRRVVSVGVMVVLERTYDRFTGQWTFG